MTLDDIAAMTLDDVCDGDLSDLPANVIAALLAAGVLQYVSGDSGPLQFTAAALDKTPAPTVVYTTERLGGCDHA